MSAGILEEIIYRGIVMGQLEKSGLSSSRTVLLSCLIFGGIHWGGGPASVIATCLWAIIPSVWYVRTRDLYGPIICHILYDALLFSGWV